MLAEDIRHPEKQPKSSKGCRKKYKRQKKETKEGGMEFCPRKGVLKRETFPKPGNLLTAESVPSFGSTEGNITGRKNKQLKLADCEPYGNSPSGEAAQTPAHAISKRGLGREAAWAASLRVRIWPEYPERYLSEIIWASKPDCGMSTMQKPAPT